MATAFLGSEGGGGRGSVGTALPGQECIGYREVKINMFLGVWQDLGVEEGTVSTTAPVGNSIPQASRSAKSVFFARMDLDMRR